MAKKGGKKKGGKKKGGNKKATHGQKGKGFMDVMKKIGGVLKDTKILSTVGSLIPHAGVQTGARLLGSIGLGQEGNGAFRFGLPKGLDAYKIKKTQEGGSMNLHGVRSTTRPMVPIVKL